MAIIILPCFSENEIDGEAFLLLKDVQIKSLVKAIGAHTKLIKKRDILNASCSKQKVDNDKLREYLLH